MTTDALGVVIPCLKPCNLILKSFNEINKDKKNNREMDRQQLAVAKYIHHVFKKYDNVGDIFNNMNNMYVLICDISKDKNIKQYEISLSDYCDKKIVDFLSIDNYLMMGFIIVHLHPFSHNELIIHRVDELFKGLGLEDLMIKTVCRVFNKKVYVPINYFNNTPNNNLNMINNLSKTQEPFNVDNKRLLINVNDDGLIYDEINEIFERKIVEDIETHTNNKNNIFKKVEKDKTMDTLKTEIMEKNKRIRTKRDRIPLQRDKYNLRKKQKTLRKINKN